MTQNNIPSNESIEPVMPFKYRAKVFAEEYSPTARWILAIIILGVPPLFLAFRPNDYTPTVQVMLSVGLFFLAYWIGNKSEAQKAVQQANDRWLPQAESVILRLMTLHSNVRRFSHSTKAGCASAQCDLPELNRDDFKPIRIKLKADCAASSQRLDDIAHQLEDAIEDWRRFVAANCSGEECSRIFDALTQRDAKLAMEIGDLSNPIVTAAPSPVPAAAN